MKAVLKKVGYLLFWVGWLLFLFSPAISPWLTWGFLALLVGFFTVSAARHSSRPPVSLSDQTGQVPSQQSPTRAQKSKPYEISARDLRERELERLWREWITQADSYFAMNSQQFEDAVADLFRKRGYQVQQTPYSGDSGIDAIAWKDGKKYFIQCKRYAQGRQVTGPDMQEFIGAMATGGNSDAGFYVTTGGFTPMAINYAKGNKVEPIGKAQLVALHHEVYAEAKELSVAAVMCAECGSKVFLPLQDEPARGQCPNGHLISSNICKADLRLFSSTPICKKCGARMRAQRRGSYLKCTNPRCYYTQRTDSRSRANADI